MDQNDEVRSREDRMRSYFQKRRLLRFHSADRSVELHTEQIAPRDSAAEAVVAVYRAHGVYGGLVVPLAGGRKGYLSARDGGDYIGGLPEVAMYRALGYRLVLEVCSAGSAGDPTQKQPRNMPPPYVDDPLEVVALGAHASNASGMETDAHTMSSGIGDDYFGPSVAGDGTWGRRVRFRPEPSDDGLARLAREAELHTGPGVVEEATLRTMLRLVRALRRVFGLEIEDSRGVRGGLYERVLKGIGALEKLRANDVALGRFTPFRMDLWSHYAQVLKEGRTPQQAHMDVLELARARWDAEPGASLGKVLQHFSVDQVLDWFSQAAEFHVADVVGTGQTMPVGPADTARAFWANVRSHSHLASLSPAEVEQLGRQVLHLPHGTPWAPWDHAQLVRVIAQAIAQGLDIGNPEVLAAYHLVFAGAFETSVLLLGQGDLLGFNWSGVPAPGGVNTGVVVEEVAGWGGTSFAPSLPPWARPGQRAPIVIWTGTDPTGTRVLHLPRLAGARVADGEFQELLWLARRLHLLRRSIPVLFLASGHGAPGPQVPEWFFHRTRRVNWSYSGLVNLIPSSFGGPLTIQVLGEPGTGAPGRWLRNGLQQPAPPGVLATASAAPGVFDADGPAPDEPTHAQTVGGLQTGEDAEHAPPSRTVEPRFPYLYADNPGGGPSRYQALSKQYEEALRMVLSVHFMSQKEVHKALDALFDYYEPYFGTHTFALFANRRIPLSPQQQFTRLKDFGSDATLDERIDAFADAVFSNPDYPKALAKLWARKPELNPQGLSGMPDAVIPYSPEVLQRAREYGHVLADGPAETITHLMRVWRALEVPQGNPLGFRNALIAWGLRRHSLAEVLAATQKAGVRDETEPSRPVDAARLHAWSDAQFDPRRMIGHLPEPLQKTYGMGSAVWNSLRQPHERWFHELWSDFDIGTRETLDYIATLAELEGASLVLPPGLPARRRRALMEVWERQGTKNGVRNLRAGHLLGLYLATGADRRLLQVHPSHSTGFARTDSPPLRPELMARDLVLDAWKGRGEYPALFRTDEVFRQRLVLAERHRQDDRRATLLRALISRAAELAEVGASIYGGYEELASEAAERLIPAHRRAWFGEWTSGPVDGPHTFGDAQGVIRKGRLHLVSVNRRALLDDLSASAAKHEGEHLVLYEVLTSSAREVSPFLPEIRDTDRGKALYPVEVAYQYGGYRIERDDRLGLSYVVATLEELPQPLAPEVWDREFVSRTIRDRNGTQSGVSFVSSAEWAAGSRDKVREVVRTSTYRTFRNGRSSDQEYPVLWKPGQVGWLDSHGNGQSLTIPSRYGMKQGSAPQVGAYARQHLRALGVSGIPIVYLACSAAKDHAVSTVMAQELADWSGNLAFAAPTVVGLSRAGQSITESGQRLPGVILDLEATADHPAPRFAPFQPRSLTDAVGPESLAQQGAWAESLYREEEWKDHAEDYEIALADKLAANGAVLETARGAVEAAGGTRPATTDIFKVMTEFFERALPQHPLKDFDATPPSDEYRDEYGRRGVRITRERRELPDLVFKRFAELAHPSYPQLLAFRKAVVAWLVGTDKPYAHSLHEVVRASTKAEVGFDYVTDAIAVAGDGAHLYLWADQALVPDGSDTRVGLPLPMNTLYRTLTEGLLTPTVTDDGWIPNGIVRVIQGNVVDHNNVSHRDVPLNGLSDRLDALGNWRKRHQGSLRKLLDQGHITALHLLSGPDGSIFRLWRDAGTPTRKGLRLGLHSIVESEFDGQRTFPRMLMRDGEFRHHARAAISHLRKMGKAKPQQADRYRDTVAHHKDRTLGAVDGVADLVYDDMPLHTAMASQGLTRLPSVGENVFWADYEPAPLTGRAGEQPPGELHTVWVPELHEASLRMDFAMSRVERESGRIRVFEVERARHAVDVSPIAWNPSLGQTFFRQETLLEVRSREIREYENEDGDVTLYEHVILREVDELPRRAAVPAGRQDAAPATSSKEAAPSDTTPPMKWYRIKNADGAAVVLAQFTPEDWKRREPALRRLADGPRYFVHWKADKSGRHAARQSPVAQLIEGGVAFYTRHGSSEPADLARMRKHLDLDSVEHVMLLECGTDGADDESSDDESSDIEDLTVNARAQRNREVARALGKTVWWPLEKVAGVLSPDGTSGAIHLHENDEGAPSNMLYSVKGGPAQAAFEGAFKPNPVPEGTRYPSDADWNSVLSATTVGIGVRPILGTDASALLQPRWDQPSRRSSTDSEPLSPMQIEAHTAQTKYGISEDDYARFRRISQSRNVVIDVLPGNPAATKWRSEGAIPKPSAVKAKSITETDVPLGADPLTVGLVGFFEPRLPSRGDRDDATWEALLARHNERRYEYAQLEPVMRRLSEAGVISVENGVVHGVKDGRRTAMSGDEDIYDITHPDGTRVSDEVHDEIIKEMEDAGTAVTHGGLRFWRPASPFSESIRDKIVTKHAVGGEPLVRFVPADGFAHLAWDGTASQGVGDPRAGRSASVP
ncbi:lonely Cys domain-containing protein, partial [Streptomyces mirabilis]